MLNVTPSQRTFEDGVWPEVIGMYYKLPKVPCF